MPPSSLRILELGNSTRGFADQREPFTGEADLGTADVVVMHFAELGNLFAQLVGQDKEAAWPRVQAGMRRLEAYLDGGGTLVAVPVATSSAYYGAQPYVKELINWAQKTIGAEPKHKTGQQVVPGDDPAYREFFETIGSALYHTMFLDNPEGPVGLMVPEGHECVATHRWVGDGGLVLALPEVKNPERRREYVDAAVDLAQALREETGRPTRVAEAAADSASDDEAETAPAAAADEAESAGADLSRRSDRAGAAIGPLERLLSSVRAASRSTQRPDNDDEDEDDEEEALGAAPAIDDGDDLTADIDDEAAEIAADEAAVDEAASAAAPEPEPEPEPERPAAAPANDDRVPAMSTVERSASVAPFTPQQQPQQQQPRRAAAASAGTGGAEHWSDHFLLPADAEIAQSIMGIEEKIAALQAEQKSLRQQLVSGKHRKALITTQGESFAAAARDAFKDLGYKVERAGNGETSFVLTHASRPEASMVAYCAGSNGSLNGREVIARLLHLEASYYATHGELPKMMAVVNAHADQPLDARDLAPSALFGEQLVDLAGQRGWCVMSGLQLMGMTLAGEDSAERREALAGELGGAKGALASYADWEEFLVKT